MSLRGKAPNGAVRKRLKLLMFSDAGVGKTIAALQMPVPYVIDAEHGTDHYEDRVRASNGVVFHTDSMDDVIEEARTLMTEPHRFRTFVVDPFTVIYDNLLDKGENEVGSEFGRHYGWAAKACKRLFNLLTNLDMNVVVICHSKAEYETTKVGGKTEMNKLGMKFDGWKKLDYIFDLVLELQRPRDGIKRIAIVRKTRLKEFPDMDQFPWSFEALAERYGADNLQAEVKVIKLATKAQVVRLEKLIKAANIPETVTDKWLDKAKVDHFADMDREVIGKCIEKLAGDLKKATADNGKEAA